MLKIVMCTFHGKNTESCTCVHVFISLNPRENNRNKTMIEYVGDTM